MPYITEKERAEFAACLDACPLITTPGRLNFLITKLCLRYMSKRLWTYADINAVVGALECAKQEIYRRVAAPYEDDKCVENGEIYVIPEDEEYES